MKDKYSSYFVIGLLLGTLAAAIVWYWQKSTRAEDGALDLLDRLRDTQARARQLQERLAAHPALESLPERSPETAVSSPKTDDLTQIKGIGAVFAGRLQQAGVRTIAALAGMDTARLAGILQTTESRAANILVEAAANS